MTTDKTGGHAFPVSTTIGHIQHGMTLRDYFAIHASESEVDAMQQFVPKEHNFLPAKWRQIARYLVADAMLAAREATG